jgi:hypothetical protein
MQVAHIDHGTTSRLALSGQTALIVLAVLTVACIASILSGLTELNLLRASASSWLAHALSWLCIGGVALAVAGVVVCCLGSFLEVRTPQPAPFAVSIARGYAASQWRTWTELRPPRFST